MTEKKKKMNSSYHFHFVFHFVLGSQRALISLPRPLRVAASKRVGELISQGICG